jgi:hypothetical protein
VQVRVPVPVRMRERAPPRPHPGCSVSSGRTWWGRVRMRTWGVQPSHAPPPRAPSSWAAGAAEVAVTPCHCPAPSGMGTSLRWRPACASPLQPAGYQPGRGGLGLRGMSVVEGTTAAAPHSLPVLLLLHLLHLPLPPLMALRYAMQWIQRCGGWRERAVPLQRAPRPPRHWIPDSDARAACEGRPSAEPLLLHCHRRCLTRACRDTRVSLRVLEVARRAHGSPAKTPRTVRSAVCGVGVRGGDGGHFAYWLDWAGTHSVWTGLHCPVWQ